MKAKETYNAIVKDIESMILDQSLKSQEIVVQIEHKYVYDARELKAVFRFLTGITPLEYVRSRRLMASYECLVNQRVRDVNAACAITQYDSQHFSNSFKAKFGMTPTDAFTRKDRSLIEPMLTWEAISCNTSGQMPLEQEGDPMHEQNRFGISLEQYDKVRKASDLEALYDFTPMFSQYAFEIAEKTGYPLERTFEYVESLKDYGGDFEEELDAGEISDGLTPDDRLRELGDIPFNQRMFFERGIHVSLISYYKFDWHLTDEEIAACSTQMLTTFQGTHEMAFSYYKKAWEYYQAHADESYIEENFEEFIDHLDEGHPIEDAFGMVYPGDFDKDVLDDMMHSSGEDGYSPEEYDEFDRWADQETDWSH